MMKRDDYIKKLKAQFDLWNVEAAKWEAKAKMVQAEMKVEYEKQFETFQRQRDEALKKMQQLQSASGDAWVELTHGADDAWAKMREAFEKARFHFRKSDE